MELKRKKNVVAARAGVKMLDAGCMLSTFYVFSSVFQKEDLPNLIEPWDMTGWTQQRQYLKNGQ